MIVGQVDATVDTQPIMPKHWIQFSLFNIFHGLSEFVAYSAWHSLLNVRKRLWPIKTEWWGVDIVSVCSEVQIVCTRYGWCHCYPKTSFYRALLCCFARNCWRETNLQVLSFLKPTMTSSLVTIRTCLVQTIMSPDARPLRYVVYFDH